nr:hypothetical protein [Agitococcus sp.]
SNTGLSDMVPTLTYMPNTGIVGSPYYGKFTCTNNGIAPATAGATCAISLPAGLSATCSPTVPTAGTVAVGASINCTVTGTPTTSGSGTFVLTTGATNDSNGGTTTGGNNQVSQAITIVDSTTAPTCSPGSTTNLLSSAGTELYFANNTATPITNNFGLIASPATYVRTGSNFVVKGNWRWRNANPAAGSPAMTYQLIVNGTVYAQLVGTPSGQEVGTLTALNGATLDGGLSTMQLYDFSVSGLAALPVGVTLPSTVTSISTLSMSFVSSTTPADDAGLAPTVLNACALPKLTLSKVSQGGVGAFAFTGNNGFSNETITTTVAGTGVAGTTQTLSAVSTPTTINETIPSGYTVTDISCTGLGSGNATPNLSTGSVTISNTALVYGANIACTYTNTKLPTITISKISQGGTGTFNFTGTNGFASQNITTSSAGVAVAGATQTLSTAATATTITETIPSGYTVTDISCTGLGAGSATPNLVSGSVSLNAAATAAGANIACTFTNTKLPTITISKISQGGTGTFNFTGTNGFASQNITTSSAGVAVAGATQTLSTAATATTITETIPSGYTVTDISCTGLGAGSATPNLVGGSVSLNPAATAAGANIACTFTNTASAFTITGKVFLDNGKNSATPHNGIQEVDEQGIGNALVRLTNCSSTVYQTTMTDGSGGYTLSIPNSLSAGTTLCVEEYQQPANLVSVSGNVGTTGGSYTLATDKVQFTLAASTNYTGVNFGDVVQSQLTGTGNQTIPAGTTASYGHQFIAGTEGSVTFSTAQAPTPLLAWTSLVYLDANCNALLDGGDTQLTSSLNVVADQVVCLLQKVQSPSTATNGSQNVSTLSASFVYAAPSAINQSLSQIDTTLIMDGGLVLVKKVREVSSCPSTGADTNSFTTNNQALPNALIEYQIVYSNPSANVVSDIVINDMTPSFTTFRSAACYSTPSSVLCSVTSSPSVGGVGSLQWVLTDNPVGLGSGQSGEVRFCVRVDQ